MSAPLRAVIVDDEAPARALLREYLSALPNVEIAGECANGFEAVKAIGELAPDLVFLDVQMPKLDGFEVLELLDPRPAVVFCTAYDEYALKAFEANAVDYLLKPFGRDRLAEAIARVRERLGAHGHAAAPAKLRRDARPPGARLDRIVVRDGARVEIVPVDRIDWIEAQDDYVAIHAGEMTLLKPQPLAELEQALDPARFVRIHRSCLLQVDRLARLEPYGRDGKLAVLKSGAELPVSRSGLQRLRELLGP